MAQRASILLCYLLGPVATATEACESDVPAPYGDARVGASGFAELVGVVCRGTCYAEASRWSAVAVEHGDGAVPDADSCRTICAATSGCAVWTLGVDGACWLMRQLDDDASSAIGPMPPSAPADECTITTATTSPVEVGAQGVECCASIERSLQNLGDEGRFTPPAPPSPPPPPPPPPTPSAPPASPASCASDPPACLFAGCTSPNGEGGYDCCACDVTIGQVGCGFVEAATCAAGLVAQRPDPDDIWSCTYECVDPAAACVDEPFGTLHYDGEEESVTCLDAITLWSTPESLCGYEWLSAYTIESMQSEFVYYLGAERYDPPPGFSPSTLLVDVCAQTCAPYGLGRCAPDEPPPPPAPPAPPPASPASCASDPPACLVAGCTSPNGEGGYDCCACDVTIGQVGCGFVEPATCAAGLVAQRPDPDDIWSCTYECVDPAAACVDEPFGTLHYNWGPQFRWEESMTCLDAITLWGTPESLCGYEWLSAYTIESMQSEFVYYLGAERYDPPPGFSPSTLLVDVCAQTCAPYGLGRCAPDEPPTPPAPPAPPPPAASLQIDAAVCSLGGCEASFSAALHARTGLAAFAPLPAERCAGAGAAPAFAPAAAVGGGADAAASGPPACGAALPLPFPNGLDASVATAAAAAAAYAPKESCFAAGRLYGAGAGSCAAAPPALVAVIASAAAIARGVSAGWWDGAATRLVAVEGWRPSSPSECQRWCEEEEGGACGGFMVSHGVCQLRAPAGCDAPLGDAAGLLPSPALLVGHAVVAGVPHGCTDNSDAYVNPALLGACPTPRCTEPAHGATFEGELLRPAECFYAIFDNAQMMDVFRGKWTTMVGYSNLVTAATLFANMNGDDFFGLMVEAWDLHGGIDIIWTGKHGVYTPVYTHRWSALAPFDPFGSDALNEHWTAGEMEHMVAQLGLGSQAAAYAADVAGEEATVRMTLVLGGYYPNAQKTIANLQSEAAQANGWAGARMVLFVSIGIWYMPDNSWAARHDIRGSPWEDVYPVIVDEFVQMLDGGDAPCVHDERWQCVISDDVYDLASYSAERLQQSAVLSARMKELAAERPRVKILDYYSFSSQRQNNVNEAHSDTFLQVWVLLVLANTVGDNPETLAAAGCARELVVSQSCMMDSLTMSCLDCAPPAWCSQGGWFCANLRPCAFAGGAAIESLPEPSAYAAGEDPCSRMLRAEAAASAAPGGGAAAAANGTAAAADCRRVWCGSEAAGWGLGVGVFVAAALLCVLRTLLRRRGKAAPLATAKRLDSTAVQPEVEMGVPAADFAAKPNAAAVAAAAAPPPSKEYIDAIDVARIFSSVHVVLGHLLDLGAVHSAYFFGWGFTWVPWFLMLSGYILTHIRLTSRAPERVDPPLKFVLLRLASLFPMYAVGLVATLLLRIAQQKSVPNWYEMGAQGLLLQAWVPPITEQGVIGTTHLWFVACLPLYWATFGVAYRQLIRRRLTSLRRCCAALLLLALPPWLLYLAPSSNYQLAYPSTARAWYSREWGSMASQKDFWVVCLKHHPLAYWHVFLFGMVLARWRDQLKRERLERPGRLVACCAACCQLGATLGYAALLLVFLAKPLRPLAHKLSARLSVLMPLQGLILVGLSPLPALGRTDGGGAAPPKPFSRGRIDPIEICFSAVARWAGGSLGATSYCCYVLQLIAWTVWPVAYLGDSFLAFFAFLLSAAYLCGALVAAPAARVWAARARRGPRAAAALLLAPALLAALLAAIGANEWPDAASDAGAAGGGVAPLVVVAPGAALDVALDWSAAGVAFDGAVTNPSLLWHAEAGGGVSLVRAARVHAIVEAREEGTWEGEIVTEIISEWRSAVVLHRGAYAASMAGWDVAAWGLGANGSSSAPLARADLAASRADAEAGADNWGPLCEKMPRYHAPNQTLFRTVVTGAEDPKLLPLPAGSRHGGFALALSSYPPRALLDGCHQQPTAVYQMYLAAHGEDAAAGAVAVASRVGGQDCGWTRLDEKNWVGFTRGGQLYFVYSIHPHTVVLARAADGVCVSRYSTASYAPVAALAGTAELKLHGSATAVPWGDDGEEFLAIFHSLNTATGAYTSFAYTFSAEPPFAITRVSRALPLAGGAGAFVSGLALPPGADKVVVSYGYANVEARALVMSRSYLTDLLNTTQLECDA